MRTPTGFVSRMLLGTAGALLLAGAADAQWISFSEETDARLSLDTVGINDDQEKDIAFVDFDQDGWLDAVVVRKRPFSNAGARQDVLLMNEDGVLVDRTAELAGGFIASHTDARDVVPIDCNNDGWMDIAICNTFGEQPSFYLNLGEDGQGNWLGLDDQSDRIEELEPPDGGQLLTFCAIWAADLNNDGWDDLYMSSYSPGGGTTTDRMLINDGAGNYFDETEARIGNRANSAFGTSAELHDFNEDGWIDVIKTTTLYGVSPWNEIGQFIVWNDGTGHFTDITYQELNTSSPYMMTVGDVNNDDIYDVYSVQDGQDRVHLSQGMDGEHEVDYSTFDLQQSPHTTGFGGNVRLIDMDDDGDLDAGVSPVDVDIANCDFGGEFALLQNPGNGQLFDPWGSDQNIHERPHDISYFDINNDGCVDLLMGLCVGWRVFIQEGCATSQLAPLTDYDLVRGVHTGGDLAEMEQSDDQRFTTLSVPGFLAFEPNIMELRVGADSPVTSVSDLELSIESSSNTPNVEAKISMRNWNNNNVVELAVFDVMLTDSVEVLDDISNPNRFVRNSDGRVEVTVKHVAPVIFTANGFTSRQDLIEVVVTQ